MGIDPVTHKPFSHLMTEIATTLAPPQVAHLAEAALGCFKDEMLHLLTKKRVDFQPQQPNLIAAPGTTSTPYITNKHEENDDTIEKIKLSLSRAMQQPGMLTQNKNWDSNGAASTNFVAACGAFPASNIAFPCGPSFGNEGAASPWSQSLCTGSTCTGADQQGRLEKMEDENVEESDGVPEIRNNSNLFNTDCVLWDLPSDDLINPIV